MDDLTLVAICAFLVGMASGTAFGYLCGRVDAKLQLSGMDKDATTGRAK